MTRGRRHKPDETGASLVEFALVLPVFMMLLLGMFTGGLAYNRRLAVTQAAREGARYGATLPVTGPPNTWLDTVADVVVRSADGELDDVTAGRFICVALISGGTATNRAATGSAVSYNTGFPGVPAGACFDDGRPLTEPRVQVVASRTSEFEALVFTRSLNLKSQAVSRYEAG